ncbi:MAG: hypothetical protein D6679_03225 [Candidatus Hydrogenedentota bacterium]|nr:MAG: hypothetical protein D6679_03225 [Candidatus Hydrogenedentota bacterium]
MILWFARFGESTLPEKMNLGWSAGILPPSLSFRGAHPLSFRAQARNPLHGVSREKGKGWGMGKKKGTGKGNEKGNGKRFLGAQASCLQE